MEREGGKGGLFAEGLSEPEQCESEGHLETPLCFLTGKQAAAELNLESQTPGNPKNEPQGWAHRKCVCVWGGKSSIPVLPPASLLHSSSSHPAPKVKGKAFKEVLVMMLKL